MVAHDEAPDFVEADTCEKRHNALTKVLFDAPEGAFPRIRALELSAAAFMAKVGVAAAIGSFLGGGLMSLVVLIIFWKLMGK